MVLANTKIQAVSKYKVLVEKDEDGTFVASAPDFQRCHAEGDTFDEAIINIRDVIKLKTNSDNILVYNSSTHI